MSSISQMVSNAWSLSKPNRYLVQIPSASTKFANKKTNRLQSTSVLLLNCKGINIPGISFSDSAHAYAGQYPIDIPTAKTFSKLNADFYLSSNHYERAFFLEWMSDVFNESDVSFNFPEEYKRDIVIYQLPVNGNQYENSVAAYKIIDAFPKMVGDVNLSHADVNVVGEFQVSFGFTRIECFTGDLAKVYHGSVQNDITSQTVKQPN